MQHDLELHEKLTAKGWSQPEIEKTERILARADETKTKTITFFDKAVYWVALLLAIVGNLVLSTVLVPFLLILNGIYLVGTLAVLGIAFGTLFEALISTIERIQKMKYIIAGAFIPAVALVNVYVMTYLSNIIATVMKLPQGVHSPAIVSLIYVVSFCVPYLIHKMRQARKTARISIASAA